MIGVPTLRLICLPSPSRLCSRHRNQAAGGPERRLTFRRGRRTFHLVSSLSLPLSPSSRTHSRLYTYHPHSLSLSADTGDRGQAVWQAGGLVCGTLLISTGIWRRKQHYLTPQPTPHPPYFSPPSSLPPSRYASRGCFHHAARVARFVKDVAASCLFHGRLPTYPCVFRPLSFPRLFPVLSPFSPTSLSLSFNEPRVSSPFLFSALVSGKICLGLFLGRTGYYGALIGTLAQWYQGRAGQSVPRSEDSLCLPHCASPAICARCVKRDTDTPFPSRPGGKRLL